MTDLGKQISAKWKKMSDENAQLRAEVALLKNRLYEDEDLEKASCCDSCGFPAWVYFGDEGKKHCMSCECDQLCAKLKTALELIRHAAPLAWVHNQNIDGAYEWEKQAEKILNSKGC